MHGKACDQKCMIMIGLDKIRVFVEVKRGKDVFIGCVGIQLGLVETEKPNSTLLWSFLLDRLPFEGLRCTVLGVG